MVRSNLLTFPFLGSLTCSSAALWSLQKCMKNHPSCSVVAVKLIEGFRLLIQLQNTSPSHFSEDDTDECHAAFPTFKSYSSLASFDSFIIHTLKKENGTFLKSNIMHIANYNKHVSKSGYTNSLLWLIC